MKRTSCVVCRLLIAGFVLVLSAAGIVGAAGKGDFDRNGHVNVFDLEILAEFWLAGENPECLGDTDGDCMVGAKDFSELSDNWMKQYCSLFTVMASSKTEEACNVLDGTLATCWSSSGLANEWLEIDLGQIRSVTGIAIYWGLSRPAAYNIEVSTDGKSWGLVHEQNVTAPAYDDIALPVESAQYVRINCVENAESSDWAISEIYVKTDDDCLASGQWEIVWSDEFNGTELDKSKWECMTGTGNDAPFDFGLHGWGNSELQYYTDRPENIRVEEGNLVIVAREENYENRQYTSARIRSAARGDFMYGRLEARIKVPKGGGMWPAFWLMPTGDTYGRPYFDWAAHGEIDIMETKDAADYIAGTIHYGREWPGQISSSGRYEPPGADFSQEYHVYALDWEPTRMRWYVDGILYSTKRMWSSSRGDYPAPFDQPFHFLINTAVGGHYTGCTSADCIRAEFPQAMYVDYVRVYRKN